jgi:hypothetical protein
MSSKNHGGSKHTHSSTPKAAGVRGAFEDIVQPPIDAEDYGSSKSVFIDSKGRLNYSEHPMTEKAVRDARAIYKAEVEEGVRIASEKMRTPNLRTIDGDPVPEASLGTYAADRPKATSGAGAPAGPGGSKKK